MRGLAFVFSTICLGCAGAPPSAAGDARASTGTGTAEARDAAVTLAGSATAPLVPEPVSLAKAAIENAGDDEQPWVPVPWGALSFRSPIEWTITPIAQGNLLSPPKTQPVFAAVLFVSPGDPDPLVALEGALSINHCRWLPEETARVGRARLRAQIVDGACRREGDVVSIARVRYASSNVGFFVWSKGADAPPFWRIARSVDNLAPQRLMPCCIALQESARSAPAAQIGGYQQAADICTLDRAGVNPETLPKVRAALLDAPLPVACR